VGWKKPSALTRRSEASRRYRSTRSCRLSIGGTYCRSPRRSSCNVLWQGIAPLLSGAPVGGRSGIVEIGRKLVEVKERVGLSGLCRLRDRPFAMVRAIGGKCGLTSISRSDEVPVINHPYMESYERVIPAGPRPTVALEEER
jgi:hypothetical protein